MSYSIYIGQGVLVTPRGEEENEPYIEVRKESLPNAPKFLGDDMTGQTNGRHPSYGAWEEFCLRTGLHDLFFGARLDGRRQQTREVGLMTSHPGCVCLRRVDLDEVREALKRWRARPWPHERRIVGWDPKAKPWGGSDGDPCFDGILARLVWLEWWMRWALDNCDNPCLSNS